MYKIFMDFILNVYTYSEDVKKLKIDWIKYLLNDFQIYYLFYLLKIINDIMIRHIK